MIPLDKIPGAVKITEAGSKGSCWGAGEEGVGSQLLNGYRLQFCKMKEFWGWMLVIVAQPCEGTEYHGPVYFKIVQMMNFMFVCFYHNKNKHGSETCEPLLSVLFRIFHLFEIPFWWLKVTFNLPRFVKSCVPEAWGGKNAIAWPLHHATFHTTPGRKCSRRR